MVSIKNFIIVTFAVVIINLFIYHPAAMQEETPSNEEPLCSNRKQEDEIIIYPSCELILLKESDNRTYKTTFAVWDKNGRSEAEQIKWQFVRGNLKQDIEKKPSYILGSNLNIDLNVSDDAILNLGEDTQGDAESPFPWRFSITLTLPSDAIYPQGQYKGRLLFFYDADQDPIEIPLSMNYQPSRILEVESPLPIRVNATLGTIVNYPLVIHETTGAIEPTQITVAPFYARGVEDTANFLPTTVLTNTTPITISNGEQKNLDLTFDFDKGVSAGAFSGIIVLSGENSNDLNIPVELSLKRHWGWPTAILFGSIIIGFIINFYNTARQERDQLLARINRERKKMSISIAEGSAEAEFKKIYARSIEELLTWAESELEKDNPSIEAAKKYLGKIDSFIAFSRTERGLFYKLTSLRHNIDLLSQYRAEFENGQSYAYLSTHIEPKLNQYREKMAECQEEEKYEELKNEIDAEKEKLTSFTSAIEVLKKLENDLEAQNNPKPLLDPEQINNFNDKVRSQKESLNNVDDNTPTEDVTAIGNSIKKLQSEFDKATKKTTKSELSFDSNPTGEQSLAFRKWNSTPEFQWNGEINIQNGNDAQTGNLLARFRDTLNPFIPIIKLKSYRTVLAILTLVLLGLVGLIELYVNDPTFGDTILSDYLRLIVWGVGVNATQEGLFQLIGNLGSKLQSGTT